jgi:hypothetical protein
MGICSFCGEKAEWSGARKDTMLYLCDMHFKAYYINFSDWKRLNG